MKVNISSLKLSQENNQQVGLRVGARPWLYVAAAGMAFGLLLSGCGKSSSPKFRQYYVHGQVLYLKHCSNCHQKNGSGLGRIYPPLNTSDYMDNNFEEVMCLIRHGKSGEMIVNGKQFNQPMPGIPTLTDLEVAEIATYIYNTWSHQRGLIEVKAASQILNNCRETADAVITNR